MTVAGLCHSPQSTTCFVAVVGQCHHSQAPSISLLIEMMAVADQFNYGSMEVANWTPEGDCFKTLSFSLKIKIKHCSWNSFWGWQRLQEVGLCESKGISQYHFKSTVCYVLWREPDLTYQLQLHSAQRLEYYSLIRMIDLLCGTKELPWLLLGADLSGIVKWFVCRCIICSSNSKYERMSYCYFH